MNRLLLLLILLCLGQVSFTQYIYKIKADSVLITNSCDTAELIIENHTQTVPGFLYNKGRGRTEFRRVLQKISDTLVTIGPDSLRIPYAWVQGGNRWNTTGVFGTMDNNPIDFYTNSTRQGRWTNTGNLLLGSITDTGNYKLNVNGMLRAGLNSVIGAPDDQGITGIETGLKVIGNFQVITAKNEGANGGFNIFRTSWGRPGATTMSLNNFNVIAYDNQMHFGSPDSKFFSVYATSNANLVGGPVTRTKYTIGSSPEPSGWNDSYAMFGVSDAGEFTLDNNYPSTKNFYRLETGLNGPKLSDYNGLLAVRAPLRIGARQLWFHTGDVEPGIEAARITERGHLLIGSTNDRDGYGGKDIKLQVNGSALITQKDSDTLSVVGTFVQGSGRDAHMGNGMLFNLLGNIYSRIYSEHPIQYQSNYTGGDQHRFANEVGAACTGTVVTIDPGGSPLLPDNQLSLKVYGRQGAAGVSVNMLGNVGIGNFTPTAKLHVSGAVRLEGLINNNSLTHIVVADANGNLFYRDAPLALNGTMNSDLAVIGTVSAQKMLISQTGRWPDYVFSKQYQLPSLTEVENYINQHNHLPGVSSAAEVEKKGIDVAGNQAALLKKIEELTLYAIDQEKKLKDQNKEMELLRQQMAELKALILNTRQTVK